MVHVPTRCEEPFGTVGRYLREAVHLLADRGCEGLRSRRVDHVLELASHFDLEELLRDVPENLGDAHGAVERSRRSSTWPLTAMVAVGSMVGSTPWEVGSKRKKPAERSLEPACSEA